MDVDDAVELADSFNISTLPTWVLTRGGAEVARVEGTCVVGAGRFVGPRRASANGACTPAALTAHQHTLWHSSECNTSCLQV